MLAGLMIWLGGCKSSPRYDEAEIQDNTFPASFIVITKPSRHAGATTAEASVTFGGVSVGSVTELSYSLLRSDGTTANGVIDPDASWTFSENLTPGDNELTVEGVDADGATHTDFAVVTHNPFLSIGTTSASPLFVFLDLGEEVTFTVELQDFHASAIHVVELIEVDAHRQPLGVVANATDDGTGADELELDQIYTARTVVDASGEQERYFRFSIGVDTGTGVEAQYSEIFRIRIMAPLTADDLAKAAYVHETVGESYATHRLTLERAEAIYQIAQELQENPEVAEGSVDHGETAVRWVTAAGIKSVFSDLPPEVAGYHAADFAAQLTRPLGGSSTCISEPRAVLLEPFSREYNITLYDRVASILGQSACPGYEIVKRPNTKADVNGFKDLSKFGLVFIYTHGSRSSGRVWFEADEFYEPSVQFNPYHPHYRDVKAGLLGIGTHGGNPNQHYVIEPEFIYHYNHNFPERSLVYLASCSSAAGSKMAMAFIMAGVTVYAGFTRKLYPSWAQCITTSFFDNLVILGKDTRESQIAARRECGPTDPGDPNTRFVTAPRNISVTAVEGCDGFMRIDGEGSWSDGLSDYESHSLYESKDNIVRAWWDPTGNTYLLQESARTCLGTFSETSVWGEALRSYTAVGDRSEVYPDMPTNPLDADPDARYGVMIMVVDPVAQSVEFTLQPEAAYYSSDDWVHYANWSHTGGESSEQSDVCPLGRVVEEHLDSYVLELTAPDVIITDDRVEGTLVIENEYGTARYQFRYNLNNVGD